LTEAFETFNEISVKAADTETDGKIRAFAVLVYHELKKRIYPFQPQVLLKAVLCKNPCTFNMEEDYTDNTNEIVKETKKSVEELLRSSLTAIARSMLHVTLFL